MPPLPDERMRIEGVPDPRRAGEMRRGLIGSTALHLLVVALVLVGLPWLRRAPPEATRIVPIDLVRLGDETASPPSPAQAPLPQEEAHEDAPTRPSEAVPVTHAAPARAAKKAATVPMAAAVTPRPATVPPPRTKPAPHRSPAARPEPLPADSLASRLKLLARLRQPVPPLPPDPRRQDGTDTSNVAAASANAIGARDATYGVKDFIRAQVQRRWSPDGGSIGRGDWVVAVHVVLSPDGSVTRAEIVDDPRYRADSAWHDFALSARNAVLLSSPITVPPGAFDIAKDIVLDFDARQVLR